MLKHIVMWKLKEHAEGRTKAENAKMMKEMLEGLKGKITEIEHIEVGMNVIPAEAAFDVVLYSKFKDEKALTTYQNHPEHVKVAQIVGKIKEERFVVDYII